MTRYYPKGHRVVEDIRDWLSDRVNNVFEEKGRQVIWGAREARGERFELSSNILFNDGDIWETGGEREGSGERVPVISDKNRGKSGSQEGSLGGIWETWGPIRVIEERNGIWGGDLRVDVLKELIGGDNRGGIEKSFFSCEKYFFLFTPQELGT
jgi:hypothetical protein